MSTPEDETPNPTESEIDLSKPFLEFVAEKIAKDQGVSLEEAARILAEQTSNDNSYRPILENIFPGLKDEGIDDQS
jgi:hypothetical protein